ncbi:hypothetical protein E2C01_080545 [Portunus trituberculatus]|uniref:Uncharacterized protein n=1 Tax=Portunus trituberculatus TaxID=210409 RepID=A0A5B7ITI8_PORTR|nr:hypothetical protein [Portunus trituberculatus]
MTLSRRNTALEKDIRHRILKFPAHWGSTERSTNTSTTNVLLSPELCCEESPDILRISISSATSYFINLIFAGTDSVADRGGPVYEEGGAASGVVVVRGGEEGCECEVVCGEGERGGEVERSAEWIRMDDRDRSRRG